MREGMIPMSIVISPEDKKLLKKLAIDEGTTASDLIAMWLHERLEQRAAAGNQ